MCGFAGVIVWDEQHRVSRQTIEKMSARIAHRGPDGEGYYFSPDAEITRERPSIALAHRRLAILDPDPRADQPFTDHAGRWIVFNGEIYNFRELRNELSALQPGYRWRTNCDTEVLLVAYGQWGEKCLEHLNGMFAFVVWDEPTKSVFLARDRMGQKPLYLATPHCESNHRALAFASEIGALMPLDWATQSIDDLALAEYLRWGYIGNESSIYSGIRKLARGMWLRFTAGREEGDYYFWPNSGVSMAKAAAIELVASASRTTSRGGPQVVRDAFENLLEGGRPRPPFSSGWRRTRTSALQKIPGLDSDPTQTTHNHFDGSPPDRQIVLETRATVIQAVHRQLVSDVPLGCFLSGGIDSSIIAAAARLAGQLQTFSIGFDDARYDETEYALAVASHLGTQHHEFIVRPDAAADLPKLAAVFGEPFADSSALPTHYLARETREHVKVALSGDGGDELFGGYERYRAIQASRQLDRLPMALRKWISHGGACLPSGHPTSFVSKLRRFLKNIDQSAGARYSSYLRIFDDDTIGKLLQAAPKMAPDFVAGQFEDLARKSDFAQAAMATDRVSYLPDDLLTKVDRASMLHALEVRSPFMDHELVHFAAGLTTDQLLKRGPKRMLREAFADDLPAWVFKRKKMGFAVPIGDWFRKELRPMLHDHLFATNSFAAGHFNRNVVERLVEDHETRRADHSQRLYALLMLELWWCTRRIK